MLCVFYIVWVVGVMKVTVFFFSWLSHELTKVPLLMSTGIFVAVGAMPLCHPVVTAEWFVCNASVAAGRAVVALNMPAPVGVALSLSSDRLAEAGNGATLAPFSVADAVAVSVVLHFDDGSTQDYSSDPRTQFEVVADDPATLLVALGATGSAANTSRGDEADGNVVRVRPSVAVDDNPATRFGPARIRVAFPGSYAINATATLTVVALESLAIGTVPYPNVASSSSSSSSSSPRGSHRNSPS